MPYFATSNVRVFPSSYRKVNAAGKFTSERNLTNMIKALSNMDSFVVDWVQTNTLSNGVKGNLKLVIDGYYFEVDGIEFTSGTESYLSINVVSDYLVKYDDGTTTLDNATDFLGINQGQTAGGTANLKVWDGNKVVNRGYIKELIDSDGNWINLSEFFTSNNKIDPSKIDWSTIVEIIARNATKLVKEDGTPYRVGSKMNPVYFDNGIPVAGVNITVSSSGPTGSGTTGDLWFVYK